MAPNEKPRTLHYHKPAPKEVRPEDRSTYVGLGIFSGVGVVTLAGCGGLGIATQVGNIGRWLIVGALFSGSALCWTKLARGTAGSPNRFLLIGFLIGAGLMTLAEGVCFIAIK